MEHGWSGFTRIVISGYPPNPFHLRSIKHFHGTRMMRMEWIATDFDQRLSAQSVSSAFY
jgi:hypothetical protein